MSSSLDLLRKLRDCISCHIDHRILNAPVCKVIDAAKMKQAVNLPPSDYCMISLATVSACLRTVDMDSDLKARFKPVWEKMRRNMAIQKPLELTVDETQTLAAIHEQDKRRAEPFLEKAVEMFLDRLYLPSKSAMAYNHTSRLPSFLKDMDRHHDYSVDLYFDEQGKFQTAIKDINLAVRNYYFHCVSTLNKVESTPADEAALLIRAEIGVSLKLLTRYVDFRNDDNLEREGGSVQLLKAKFLDALKYDVVVSLTFHERSILLLMSAKLPRHKAPQESELTTASPPDGAHLIRRNIDTILSHLASILAIRIDSVNPMSDPQLLIKIVTSCNLLKQGTNSALQKEKSLHINIMNTNQLIEKIAKDYFADRAHLLSNIEAQDIEKRMGVIVSEIKTMSREHSATLRENVSLRKTADSQRRKIQQQEEVLLSLRESKGAREEKLGQQIERLERSLSKTTLDLDKCKKDTEKVRLEFTSKMQKLHDKEAKAKVALEAEKTAHDITKLDAEATIINLAKAETKIDKQKELNKKIVERATELKEERDKLRILQLSTTPEAQSEVREQRFQLENANATVADLKALLNDQKVHLEASKATITLLEAQQRAHSNDLAGCRKTEKAKHDRLVQQLREEHEKERNALEAKLLDMEQTQQATLDELEKQRTFVRSEEKVVKIDRAEREPGLEKDLAAEREKSRVLRNQLDAIIGLAEAAKSHI